MRRSMTKAKDSGISSILSNRRGSLQKKTTATKTPSSASCWRWILLGILWVIVIVSPFLQMYVSTTLSYVEEEKAGQSQRESTRRHHLPDVDIKEQTLPNPKNVTVASATLEPPNVQLQVASKHLNTPNFTYEIFFAPSNVEKYGSPVVPVEERQWLEAKRQQWPPKHIPNASKLPLPIFVLNLPKSGTQSIFDFFSCDGNPGKHWTAHYWMQRFHSKVGRCLADNVWHDRPMAQGCGEAKLAGYAIYTDAGLMWSEEDAQQPATNTESGSSTTKSSSLVRKCFFPGVHGLENIAKYYPTATIVHFPRNATQWVESSLHWNHLLSRYDTFCGGFPEIRKKDDANHNLEAPPPLLHGEYTPKQPGTTEPEWTAWYEAYTQRIRDFARQHPSLTYVESPLEDINGTAQLLHELTGIPESCYGRSHVNKKRRKKQE